MTLTLLLDLDDTLLASNMDAFIPAYFMALSESLKDYVPAEKMIKALMGGTRLMMAKKEPLLTLKHVFDDYFFPNIGTDRESIQQQIDKFYDQVFPSLCHLTSPIPDAVELVETAFEKGYRVVIATNPLFPAKAINHRLRWAGLPLEEYPFEIVTSYEKFHFTKENISYFPEILGKLGWPDEPVLMVGNDLAMDIDPAKSAGLPVYWVNGVEPISPDDEEIPHGSLKNLRKMFDEPGSLTKKYSNETSSAILACLRAMPALLEDHLAARADNQFSTERVKETNSVKNMLNQLIEIELEFTSTNFEKTKSFENEFNSRQKVYDSHEIKGNSVDPIGTLELFTKFRMMNLGMIQKIINKQDETSASHGFENRSLFENSQLLIVHDQTVLKQIHRQFNRNN